MKVTNAILQKFLGLFDRRTEELVTTVQSIMVRDVIGNAIDYELAVIPLPKPMSKIVVYYVKEASVPYKLMMGEWFQYHKNVKNAIEEPLKILDGLVVGTTDEKIVSYEDIDRLRKSLRPMEKLLATIMPKHRYRMGQFTRGNTETDLIDSIHIDLYAPVTEISYLKIHDAIFKKVRIFTRNVIEYLKRDSHILDQLAKLSIQLHENLDRIGIGYEYEEYRLRQHQLIEILLYYTDMIEEDIEFLEDIVDLSQTTLNTKIYEDIPDE